MFLFRLTSVIRSQLAGREFFQIGLRLARLSKVGEAIADLAHSPSLAAQLDRAIARSRGPLLIEGRAWKFNLLWY